MGYALPRAGRTLRTTRLETSTSRGSSHKKWETSYRETPCPMRWWSSHTSKDTSLLELSVTANFKKEDAESGEPTSKQATSGGYICRHHVAPRGQLYVPQESSIPVPPKYIDMNRQTRTNLDNPEETSIDDCWNVDGNKTVSEDWIGFTRFHIIMTR